ncbi:MAG: hypothetical protein ABSH53_03775 [Holophaga sp.]|jgi:hypothetical protein
MKQRNRVVLLVTLASTGAWAQEFSGFSTTMLQYGKQDVPGFNQTIAPGTEFLGIDGTHLGSDALSLHLYGWGAMDLGDQSLPFGKSAGDLSYAYLDYRFGQANAELKAGRFAVNQGAGVEQVDGVSARTDLRGGFNLSAFFGTPVHYKTQELRPGTNYDYKYQTDVIFGSRLGYRLGTVGEVGVSYLQDGTTKVEDIATPPPVDFTRKQVGTDLRLAPVARLEITGHTLFDVASHYQAPGTPGQSPSRVAEEDYAASYKFSPVATLTVNYVERNLEAYFAGTNLPDLFHLDTPDKIKAKGGTLALGPADAVQVILDYRQTDRETYGTTTRYGADVRWAVPESKYQAGGGFHKVSSPDLLMPTAIPYSFAPALFGMSREEYRAWVMYQGKSFHASLDGIFYQFDDSSNPNLYSKSTITQVVGSVGMNPTANLSVSGDLTYALDAYYKNQVSVLLRTTYRFSIASKGGSK